MVCGTGFVVGCVARLASVRGVTSEDDNSSSAATLLEGSCMCLAPGGAVCANATAACCLNDAHGSFLCSGSSSGPKSPPSGSSEPSNPSTMKW